ncbi:MAG: nucleotidyltransferase domain-containing protein [Candidatus Omnitrophica bacterium]|nr:nucleotidyltransferase domain-containing protein [Candidatus Omnitrophota bacterium]
MLKTIDKMAVKTLMSELRAGLQAIYGDRLRGLYLYGSYARGEADPESDLDVLIVLEGYDRYSAEIGRTSQLISSLCLKYSVSVSRVFVSEERWRDYDSPFLRNARAEAIAA